MSKPFRPTSVEVSLTEESARLVIHALREYNKASLSPGWVNYWATYIEHKLRDATR